MATTGRGRRDVPRLLHKRWLSGRSGGCCGRGLCLLLLPSAIHGVGVWRMAGRSLGIMSPIGIRFGRFSSAQFGLTLSL